MEDYDIDFEIDEHGTLMTDKQIKEKRERLGLCIRCGKQVVSVMKLWYLKPKPITIPGKVLNGVCLLCPPRHRRASSEGNNTTSPSHPGMSTRSLPLNISNGQGNYIDVSPQSDRRIMFRNFRPNPNRSIECYQDENDGEAQRIIEIMQSQPNIKSVQVAGCSALWNLSVIPQNQTIIGSCGGISVIIKAMKRFKQEPEIQEKAIPTLSNLGSENEENQILILQEGGVETIIDVVNINQHLVTVRMYGLDSLSNLARRSVYLRQRFVEAEGINAILVSMMIYESIPDLQKTALRAICSICEDDNTQNKTLVAKAEGISYIISAMQNHPADLSLQKHGCMALHLLAQNHKENTAFIGQNSGIGCLLNAMDIHTTSSSLCELVFEALITLCLDNRNKEIIFNAKGIQAVAYFMQQNEYNHAIQKNGCEIFSNLTSLFESSDSVRENVLRIVVNAMMLHGDKRYLVKNSCYLIQKLTKNENNLHLMQECDVALQVAKSNFPDDEFVCLTLFE